MNFSNSLAQPCCFSCTFGSERVKNWLWNITTCNEKIAMVVFYSLLNAMLDSVTFNNHIFANIWCMQRRLIKLWGCSYVLLICSAEIYLGSELALAVELCSPGWSWMMVKIELWWFTTHCVEEESLGLFYLSTLCCGLS